MVSLAKPEIVRLSYVQLSVVIVAKITTISNIHLFYEKYIKVL